MAEGSSSTVAHGSRQLSITHSHSLKGRLQCSCPTSLCSTMPYFILSALEHCSSASITTPNTLTHTHTNKMKLAYRHILSTTLRRSFTFISCI